MLFSVAMFPTSKATASVSADVAKVIDIIDKSGLPYQLTAMSTLIEGEWDEVMPVLNKARLTLRETHDRVYMVLTMDDRKGAKNRLTGKVASIEKRLEREVRK